MIRLTFYNLSVKLETDETRLIDMIRVFLENFYTQKQQKGFSQAQEVSDKIFATKVKNRSIYIFHSNQFIHLYHYLTQFGYKIEPTEKVDMRDYKVVETHYKVRDGWKPYDYQEPIIDFLLDSPQKSKLVPIQTGRGKTSTALFTIARLNQRLGIVILPTFIEKWVQDICTVHEAVVSDVLVVQGSKALKAVIELAKTDSLDNDYIIFSSRTMQEYINQYEEDPDLCKDIYGCEPTELFPLLGIGIMLVDETHMHYHSIYKTLINTNVKFQIGLSATLLSDDNLISRMHKVVYPDKQVYKDGELDKYAFVYPISYTVSPQYIKFIKTKNFGSNNYSHNAFEKSVMKRQDMLDRYINIIKAALDDYYIDDYKEQDKVIVFVATVALATKLTEALSDAYQEFKVKRYCEEDSYTDMLSGEIIVSTPISAGTALDIPRLRTAILTVSIASTPTNIQILGRLRKLKDRDVKFCYLYASNINKQREYHLRKMELFKNRVANICLRASRLGM